MAVSVNHPRIHLAGDEGGVSRLRPRVRRGSVQHLQNLLGSCQSVRIPVPDFRLGPVSRSRWPARLRPNESTAGRYARRPRKLTPADESTIQALAGTKSLRSLAADSGVSHETIRAVIPAETKARRVVEPA